MNCSIGLRQIEPPVEDGPTLFFANLNEYLTYHNCLKRYPLLDQV